MDYKLVNNINTRNRRNLRISTKHRKYKIRLKISQKKQDLEKCVGDILDFCQNIKNESCCVCYEKTRDKLPCGHSLCNNCINEIKNHDNLLISCPYCRWEPDNINDFEAKRLNIESIIENHGFNIFLTCVKLTKNYLHSTKFNELKSN